MVRAGFAGRMGPPARKKFTDPLSLSGLSVWLDSSDASTITKDGSNLVSQWRDKSGNANHFAPTSAAKSPTWVDANLNAKPILRFTDSGSNATSSGLQAANDTAYAEETVFVVVKRGTLVGTGDAVMGMSAGEWSFLQSGASTAAWIILNSAAGNSCSTIGGVQSYTNANYLYPRNIWTVASGRRSNVVNSIDVRENGVITGKSTHSAGASTSAKYRIGYDMRNNNASQDVAEVVVYNRYLSDTEMRQVEDYLNAKWNVYAAPEGIRALNRAVQLYFFRNGLTSLGQLPAQKPAVILFGQSNSRGYGAVADLPPELTGPISNAYIWDFNTSAFVTLEAGVSNQGNTDSHGAEMPIGYSLALELGEVYIIKNGVNSTNLYTYWNANPQGSGYNALLQRFQGAIDSMGFADGTHLDLKLVLKQQGETDADNSTWAAAYYDNLVELYTYFLQDFEGATDAQWAECLIRYDSSAFPAQVATVAAAQQQLAADNANVTIVGPWGTSTGDGLHADSASQIAIGNEAVALI